ncbi:MAG TPA: M23 family metallopeptidase [Jatrophihabitans sp.]|nr:M23 family metallopeptidase [Jatrophihabitans sp.]
MPGRVVLGLAFAVLLSTSAAGAPRGPGAVGRTTATARPGPVAVQAGAPVVVGYVAPLPEPLHVLRRFDPPATPYGPGHRGVDLRPGAHAVVRAPAGGVVSFAGSVAGRGVVVVRHPDGIRTEYEPVRPLVRAGDAVRRGQPIGEVRGTHAGCAGDCLHWGARRGTTYLDPLALLRPLGPVVLLPWPR